jgi:hypothetical protein
MPITHEKLSNDLKQLFELSVDMAMALIEKDHTFLPFMFKQSNETKEHIVFTGNSELKKKTISKAIQGALHDLLIIRFVAAYSGMLTSGDGERYNAIILEGSEKGQDRGFVFAKRYKQNENGACTWVPECDFIKQTNHLRIMA